MPKSAPPLAEIGVAIKKLLKKYEPPFVATADFDARYDLYTKKEISVGGRKPKRIMFAAMIIQSSYVGFYSMGIYSNPALKKKTGEELLATLKGKSCFHIKSLDPKLMHQIKDHLALTLDFYKKQGWV